MTEETKVVEVGEIHFQLNDRTYLFTPTNDITAKEVCYVLQMVLNVMAQKSNNKVDLGSFIAKHNLTKHFAEFKAQETT